MVRSLVHRLPAKQRSMPLEIAKCGIERALRPFLRHPSVPFVAVLIVPFPDEIALYRTAAEQLLDECLTADLLNDEAFDHTSMAEAFEDLDNASTISSLNFRPLRRTVVMFEATSGIPNNVLLAVDLVVSIPPPVPVHVATAARRLGIQGMTAEQAAFLCGRSFREIRLAMPRGRSVSGAIRRLKEISAAAVEDKTPPRRPGLGLEDMHGYGPAKTWGLQLARDMEDFRQGRIAWKDMDTGALLSGPPGCGKTSFASALAVSCNADLILASAARWQAKGHLGDYLKEMRHTFAEARKKAPCILLLDEFDSFGDRETESGNGDSMRQVINGLLECLDGADGREGVVVIGATNHPGNIDAALLRPGRIECHLEIPLPDQDARIAILCQHMVGADLLGDPTRFGELSEGFTGADIEKVAKAARRRARLAGRDIQPEDVLHSMPARQLLDSEDLMRVAVHETGHAIVGILVCRTNSSTFRFLTASTSARVSSRSGTRGFGGRRECSGLRSTIVPRSP